jgi:plasmid stability protein
MVYSTTEMEPFWRFVMAATITIKNIPSGLYDVLKKNAARNHRSINNEIIAIFESTLFSKRIAPDEFLASARKLREKTKGFKLTEDFIDQAKSEGRL